MSDYHVLQSSPQGKSSRVIFHIPVPDTPNAAGVSWQTALAQARQADSVSSVAQPTEQAAINAGELYEYSDTVLYSAHSTDTEKIAAIEAAYALAAVDQLAYLSKQLKYWGYSGDVA